MEILAGVLGCLVGVIGFLPYALVAGWIRRKAGVQDRRVMKFIVLIPFFSIVLMLAAILLFWWLAADYLVIFAIASLAVFLVGTASTSMVRQKK
ncbi:MAG: hypothetical protein FWF30_01875 [Coriobacteriia bacterium]|nr:hypothetical protein [Coriobacteriia bacterium]